MAEFGNTNQELLNKNENIGSPGELSRSEGEGGSRSKSNKGNDAESTKDVRKKKQDALEGKDQGKDTQESSEDDKGHHTADKAEADDSGSHSRQGLQSGQTTVQFSSGGGVGGGNANMASSLTSLLGLFASSAALARTEIGAALNITNQSITLSLRANFQASTNQLGNLIGEEGRLVKGTVGVSVEQTSESAGNKFTSDSGLSSTSHSSNGGQDTLTNLLKNISAQAAEGGNEQGTAPTLTIFTAITSSPIFYPAFNSSNFFASPGLQFVFTNNTAQNSIYPGIAKSYITDAGLPITSTYSYEVLSPVPTLSTTVVTNNGGSLTTISSGANTPFSGGLTILQPAATGTLTTQLSNPTVLDPNGVPTFQYPDSSVNGLTFSPTGDLQVNVTKPMSVLLDIIPLGQPASNGLIVRVDAGIGGTVTSSIASNSIYNGASISSSTIATGIGSPAIEPGVTAGGVSSDGTSFTDTFYTQTFQYTSTVSQALAGFNPNVMVGSTDANNNFLPTILNPADGSHMTIIGEGERLAIDLGNGPQISVITATSLTTTYQLTQYTYNQSNFDSNGNLISTTTGNFISNSPWIPVGTPTFNAASYQGFNFAAPTTDATTTYSVYSYTFPTDTIYRHVGNSLTTIPTDPTFGNFASLTNTGIPSYINLPAGPTTMDITFGGNVLDVYGTKYGEGDALIINVPSFVLVPTVTTVTTTVVVNGVSTTETSTTVTYPPTPTPNTITFGGNTLAGFGEAYGDMKSLTISSPASTGVGAHTSVTPTDIVFLGNILNVDKGVNSILYPHLQTLYLSNQLSNTSNIHITFNNSIISGNIGDNNFYSDIRFLGDMNNTSLYNGFINGTGVTVPINTNGQVEIQVGNNTITYGTDVYTGGHNLLNAAGKDAYNLTLVGDSNNNPVMEGNVIITDFSTTTDSLTFQITPSLFKSLDGTHHKTVSILSLDSEVVFSQPNSSIGDPNIPTNSLGLGTIISFKDGGSLSLVGNSIGSFGDIPNFNLEMNLTYLPVTALTTAPTQPLVYGSGPSQIINQPSVFFNELDNVFTNSLLATYEATIPTSATNPNIGATVTHTQVTTFTGTILQNGVPEILTPQDGATTILTSPNYWNSTTSTGSVTIDPYGSISVTTTTPILTPLQIIATDQTGHTATSTYLFGFLDAPTTTAGAGDVVVGNPHLHPGNILEGSTGSTLIGFKVTQDENNSMSSTTLDMGDSALIIDTAGGALAYGDSQQLNFNVPASLSLGTAPLALTEGNHYNIAANALDVVGNAFGVANTLSIIADGAVNASITILQSSSTPVIADASSQFINNTFNFNQQTLYGAGEATVIGQPPEQLVGDIGTISISIAGGTNNGSVATFNLSGHAAHGVTPQASLDVSGDVTGNVFNFAPTSIVVVGDTSTITSNLVANVYALNITATPGNISNTGQNLTVNDTAVFTNNSFIFQDDTLKGGAGTTNFQGHLSYLGDPYGYAATTPNPFGYTGFVNGITVSDNATNHLVLTDRLGNSITYGNNTYTGGAVKNTYSYTIVEDINGNPIMQGHDTITNFNPTKDTIVFNIESNLYAKLGMVAGDSQEKLAQILYGDTFPGGIATQTHSPYVSLTNGVINFTGGGATPVDYGSITLENAPPLLNTLTLDFLLINYPLSLQINSIGTPYQAPSIVTTYTGFDPVKVNAIDTNAFGGFFNVNPTSLTYSVAGGPTGATPITGVVNQGVTDYTIVPGIVYDSAGTLTLNLDQNAPVDTYLTVSGYDGINTVTLPTIHIFALATTDDLVHTDTTTNIPSAIITTDPTTLITTTTYPSLAFETSAPGNTVIAGGADLSYNNSQNTAIQLNYGSNLIYDVSTSTTGTATTGHTGIGDVQNITFSDTAGYPGFAAVSGVNILFNSNLFNVNAYDTNSGTNGAGVYGNDRTLSMTAAGSFTASSIGPNETTSNPVNDFITGNTITSLGNTEYGSGNLYGNMQTLSMIIVDPTPPSPAFPIPNVVYGSAFIQGNTFTFAANNLTSQPVSSTLTGSTKLYPSIGTLIMANQETGAFPHAGISQIGGSLTSNGNVFTFGNSTLTGGATPTHFYGDIADLSNTDFETQLVTLVSLPASSVISVEDISNNVINWGNDIYKTPGTGSANIFTFNLLHAGNLNAVMQGNAEIQGFRAATDALDLRIPVSLFQVLNTNFDRSLSVTELNTSGFTSFTTPNGNAKLSFDGGSITFDHDATSITSYTSFAHLTVEAPSLAGPVTPVSTTPAPLILLSHGGSAGNGFYGLALDSYFNNVDIANASSTYTVANVFTTSFPALGTSFPALELNTNAILFSSNNFGSITAHDVIATPNTPVLSLETITATDPDHPGNSPTPINLLIGEFESSGIELTDTQFTPNGSGVTTMLGAASTPSYLHGSNDHDIMVGNSSSTSVSNADLVYTAPTGITTYQFENASTYGGILYTNSSLTYGGNMLINTNTNNNTVAYGDFENININILNTSTSLQEVQDAVMQFGQNVFYANGTVYGVADNFIFDISQPSNLTYTNNQFLTGTIVLGYNATPSVLNGNYGNETIYGQGNLYGVLNTLEIADHHSYLNSPIFEFAQTEIVVTGNQYSNVFSNLDRLVVDIDSNLPSTFITFSFGNTIAIGGSGGANFYPSINDLSSTAFWTNQVSVTSGFPTIRVQDTSGNVIDWGTHQIFLSTGSHNIINFTLLDGGNSPTTHLPVLNGVTYIWNFDPTLDVIRFNLSQPLYNYLLSQGPITNTSLSEFTGEINFRANGTEEDIAFSDSLGGGNIALTGYGSNPLTLAQLEADSFQIGTTFNGTAATMPGTSDASQNAQSTFMFTVSGSDLSSFHEYDQITNFDTSANSINFTLSQSSFDLAESSILFGTQTSINSAITTGNGTGISISHSTAQFDSTNNVTVDSTLNFMTNGVTSGSIMLHNVNITNLSDLGSHLQFGQVGATGGGNTFTYVIPANIANTINAFTDFSYITNFNVGANPDHLQLILPVATYQSLTTDHVLTENVSAAQLETAGLTVVTGTASTPTLIEFPGVNGGEIALFGNTTITAANLGTYLHIGYLDQGTAGTDTFSFTDTGTSFGAFTQFDHVTNFSASQDNLPITVAISLADYNSINTEGNLSGATLYNSLATHASTVTGGIVVTHPTAQYNESGGSNVDTVFNFETSGVVDGSITLHNVNTDLASLGSSFHFGSTQAATTGETIAYNTPAQGVDMSAFTQFSHITNFDVGNDFINISLPVAEFNNISGNGTFNSSTIESNLTNPNLTGGNIHISTVNGSTDLDFVTNGNTANPWGSIILDGVTINQLTDFGSHLQFGSIQQASGSNTIEYSDAANGSANNNLTLSAFQEFDHLLDFSNAANATNILQIDIPNALYNEIDNVIDPLQLPGHHATSDDLAQALATGSVTGTLGTTQLNTSIVVVQNPAQYGSGHDSVLEFMTGTTITGTVTLHNISINSITDLSSPNLAQTHLLIHHS